MMKKKQKGLLTTSLLLLASVSLGPNIVLAEGSASAGAQKARTCQVCHGTGGHSTDPNYPVLAGQHAKYLQKQLRAFREGTRKDPIMNGMATPLSDQDIEDIAAYFESIR